MSIKNKFGQFMRYWMIRHLQYCGYNCIYERQVIRDLKENQSECFPSEIEWTLDLLNADLDGEVFFIQIGGFDGQSDDLLFQRVKQYRWKGLIVEPQKPAFKALVSAYGDKSGINFACCAIGREAATVTLFKPTAPEGSLNASRFASRDPEHVMRHLKGLRASDLTIITEEVVCITPDDLLREYGVSRIDLLAIDAEGSDAEILQAFNFAVCCPRVILFEHANLSDESLDDTLRYLRKFGFSFLAVGADVICTRKVTVGSGN